MIDSTKKLKVHLFLALVSSLFVFLKWGTTQAAFLYEMEGDILLKLFSSPLAVLHPFTIIPLIGQLLLLIAIIQKRPNYRIIKLGIGSLLFLIGFVFIIGLFSMQFTILISTVPFITLAMLSLMAIKKQNAG